MSLNQIDKLLETLVGWLVWDYQVTDELVGFRSTRTEENGTLLGGCVKVIGGKVFLEALCIGTQSSRPCTNGPTTPFVATLASHLRHHFVVSAPRRYEHLHAFKQQ